MRTVARYQCEKCRKIYDIPGEAIACEAGHYGLSVDEYNKWLALKKLAENAGKMVSIAKNEKTDRAGLPAKGWFIILDHGEMP